VYNYINVSLPEGAGGKYRLLTSMVGGDKVESAVVINAFGVCREWRVLFRLQLDTGCLLADCLILDLTI